MNATVNDMFIQFERDVLPHLSDRTRKDYSRHVRELKHRFGHRPVGELTRSDIQSFLNVPRGRIQRNRMVATLSSAISRAISWGMVESNVCAGVPRNKRTNCSGRNITLAQFEAIKHIASPRIRLSMELVRYTEQLPGAIINLRWAHVDEVEGVVDFHPRERRRFVNERGAVKTLEVRITPELQAVLDECRKIRNTSDYVLPTIQGTRYTSEGFRAVWQRVMDKWESLGNERITFHDIKRWSRLANGAAKSAAAEDTIEGYSRFDECVRRQAAAMSRHYQVLFCLERAMRQMITSAMEESYGADWWDTQVSGSVVREVDALVQKEVDGGMRQRSERLIDYTTFGQLREIVVQNWAVFEKRLTSKAAVTNVMATLSRLRGPIAHCCGMQPDEADRLTSTVQEWLDLQKR